MDAVVPGLTFIIPAYNEEGAIVGTTEQVKAVLATIPIPSEVIIVNDGSDDHTQERAESIPGVRVVQHPINIGYGSAIKSGILCAQYEWIGIIDADGTYDVNLIPALVDKMQQGFDMAVAARSNVLQLDRPFKRFMRMVMIRLIAVIINGRIVDANSGLRIFSRSMALTFFPFLCDTFSFTTSITIFALGEAYFVSYIPMTYAARIGASKVRHFRDSLRMMQLMLQGIVFFNPIKLAMMTIVALIVFGGLPTLAAILFGWPEIGLLHLSLTVASAVLFLLGTYSDMLRITLSTRINSRTAMVARAGTNRGHRRIKWKRRER